MFNLSQVANFSVIKSVQYVSGTAGVSSTADITISSVNTSKTVVICNGAGTGGDSGTQTGYAKLQSATSVRIGGIGNGNNIGVSAVVVEFW